MKIEIESIDDLNQLVSVLSPAYLRAFNTGLGDAVVVQNLSVTSAGNAPSPVAKQVTAEVLRWARGEQPSSDVATAGEPDGLPTDIEPPVNNRGQTYDEAVAATAQLHEAMIGETLDADGARYDTRWHSEPAKINADGRWRARRKRDEDAYKAWLLEQAVEVAEAAIAADAAEPVATETHALPAHLEEMELVNDEMVPAETQGAESDPRDGSAVAHGAPPTSTVDLEALIAASQEAAQDASDSHVDLLNACRDFTSKHGHPAFTALKTAVAPDDAGGGKAVQHFTPGERRLMQACIANYPSN